MDEALRLLFHGKCAFCECRVETRPYRFRPTNDADPRYPSETMSHLSYGWLADVWENLYPICLACRPRQRNLFPVWNGVRSPIPSADEYRNFVESRTASWPTPLLEHPYLLDPCGGSQPWNHLMIDGRFRLLPRSEDGKFTIEQFDLNRKELVLRRSEALTRYLAGSPPTMDDEFYGVWAILKSQQENPSSTPEQPNGTAADVAAPAPRIRSVRLRNFKALEDVQFDVPFHPLAKHAQAVLILGENAAGKSSILEGIALCMLPQAGLEALGEPPDKYRLDPSLMGASPDLKQRSSASVEVTFDDGSQRKLTITDVMKGQKKAPPYPVYAYGAYRHYLEITREWSPERPVISLFRSDNLISNPESWLLSLSEEEFDEVVQALRLIFGAVETFALIEREPERNRCYVVGPRDGNPIRTPLSSVSSGFRTVLALACDVMRWTLQERSTSSNPRTSSGSLVQSLHNARGLVLIDEVEAHLHPRWKIQIMQGLRSSLPSMTFIVTTHDPLCVRGMARGEVKVLRRVREMTVSNLPLHVETLTDLPDPTKLTVEQLLTSDLFGLYSADDPWTEQRLARLADYITGNAHVRSIREVRAEWRHLRDELAGELPMGQTEPARLIQEVVAEYMIKRGSVSDADRRALRAKTKKFIRDRLGDML